MPTADDYLRSMAAYAQAQTPELTDTQPGSIFRSLLEALAVELESTWAGVLDQNEATIREAAYRLWSFDRRPPIAASGAIRLTALATISTAIPILAGTLVRVPGTDRIYSVLVSTNFPAGAAGSQLTVQVASIGAGAIYNTSAGSITEFVNPITNLSVTNPSAFINGRDEETDSERQQRFATYLQSIHRATASSLEYAALQAVVKDTNGVVIEAVTHAKSIDVSAGLARVYLANGTTSAASAGLITAAAALIAGYKAAGITVDVQAAALTSLSVTCAVTLSTGYSLTMLRGAIERAIIDQCAKLGIGAILYREQLQAAILAVPGVIDLTMSSPVGNTDPGASGRVVLSGTPTIT